MDATRLAAADAPQCYRYVYVSSHEPDTGVPSGKNDPPAFAVKHRAGLLDFWNVYEGQYESVQDAARALAQDHREFGPLIRAMSPEQMQEEGKKSRQLLKNALVSAAWGPYVANARMQGTIYAKLGVTFGGWYEVVGIFQRVLLPALVDTFVADPPRLSRAIGAMMAFIDYGMTVIAEQYLLTSEEERFRKLIESIEDYAIFMLDPEGRVATWNEGARRLKGYEAHEIIGKHFSVFQPADDEDSSKLETILHIAETSGRYEEEVWHVRKDGTRFWAAVVLTPIRTAGGTLTGFAEVTRDLTERRRAEVEQKALVSRLEERTRQLEEANTELDGFTYSVSHDLRAPLRAIDGFVRVLVEDHALEFDDEGKRVARIISKNTEKMGRLIDDLLNFARLGRTEMRTGPISMSAMAKKAAEEVLDPKRTIDLHVAVLPPADGDPALIYQVWLNLLGNAVKYSRSRSRATIDVSGETRDGETVYSIKDNGVGFDPEYESKLFGVFQRLHAASEFEGTGVGLALVQRIVRRHGGWVKAEGKLGDGATFSFALPRKD